MCCGSGGASNKVVRSSVTPQVANKQSGPIIIKKMIRNSNGSPSPVHRQYAIPRNLCPKCGKTTMLVHIANRERQQCTNIDCRFVIQ